MLQRDWDHADWSGLRRACGVFCAVHYSREPCRLTLIADKLGLRPVYYWIDDDRVVFATALRVLEEHADVPKRMDLRAVTEMANFGAPLADRTPYAGIRVLQPAEILRVSPGPTGVKPNTTIVNEGLARWHYNGATGYGMWNLKNWARIVTLVFTFIGAGIQLISFTGSLLHFNIFGLFLSTLWLALYVRQPHELRISVISSGTA